jgi:hypothetical protein
MLLGLCYFHDADSLDSRSGSTSRLTGASPRYSPESKEIKKRQARFQTISSIFFGKFSGSHFSICLIFERGQTFRAALEGRIRHLEKKPEQSACHDLSEAIPYESFTRGELGEETTLPVYHTASRQSRQDN